MYVYHRENKIRVNILLLLYSQYGQNASALLKFSSTFRRFYVLSTCEYLHTKTTKQHSFNPLMCTLKPDSNEPLYSNTAFGTLAVGGWAVTFDTTMRALGGLRPRPVPSLLQSTINGRPVYQLQIIQCGTLPAPVKGLTCSAHASLCASSRFSLFPTYQYYHTKFDQKQRSTRNISVPTTIRFGSLVVKDLLLHGHRITDIPSLWTYHYQKCSSK